MLWRENEELCLELASRKNRQSGSGVIRRRCTCQGNKDICPVHVLWESFAVKATPGERLWPGVTAGIARTRLRQLLSRLHVDNAMLHNTHDFRRGHARVWFAYTPYDNAPIFHFHMQDLWRSGATLAEILTAGQWKSAAFLRYLDEAELEKVRFLFSSDAVAHVPHCFAGDGFPSSHRIRPRRC